MAKKKTQETTEKKKAEPHAEGRWFTVELRVKFRHAGAGDEASDDEVTALEDELMRRIDHFKEQNGFEDSSCERVRRASS